MFRKITKWWNNLVHPKGKGWIKCGVCGEWGIRNTNYKYVDTFLHYNRSYLSTYVHQVHQLREWAGKQQSKNLN